MTPLLALRGLTRRYSGLVAVDAVDLEVMQGGVHAVIGPNGAGKTTLFNLISGLAPPSGGAIELAGQDVTRLPPDRRAALGLGRTFQNIRVFTGMTVLENVLTGLHTRLGAGLVSTVLRLPRFRAEERRAVARARAALDLVGLAAKAEWRAGALSYGDQRRLEIARAMAPEPRLLLLDEPAAGMNPAETEALATLVRSLRGSTTVLLVEQNFAVARALGDHVAVMDDGRVVHSGSMVELAEDDALQQKFLGLSLGVHS